MSRDVQEEEAAYIADLLRQIALNGPALDPPLDVVSHEVCGSWPETELRLFFRVVARSRCIYGVRDRLWDEDPLGQFGVERAVTHTWLRIMELVEATPYELPEECDPDVDGVTWVKLRVGFLLRARRSQPPGKASRLPNLWRHTVAGKQ